MTPSTMAEPPLADDRATPEEPTPEKQSQPENPSQSSDGVREDLEHALRGLCMGGADVVPGISGGTVALVLGIYGRLVTAISRVDLTLLGHLRHGRLKSAARHLDLRFLAALACGILAGFVVTSLFVTELLEHSSTRPYTLAVFFGMIAASAVLVLRMIRVERLVQWIPLGVAGTVAALFSGWLTLQGQLTGDPALWYLFLCGSVAICAMILPGISGAMVLLILGVYPHLTEIPRQLLRGEDVSRALSELVVFGLGCGISLVAFSKLLRWLLSRHHAMTMAVLCGLMFGALLKLWPFQLDMTPKLAFKYKTLQPFWPTAWDATSFSVVATALIAMLGVFLVDRWSRRRRGGSGLSTNL